MFGLYKIDPWYEETGASGSQLVEQRNRAGIIDAQSRIAGEYGLEFPGPQLCKQLHPNISRVALTPSPSSSLLAVGSLDCMNRHYSKNKHGLSTKFRKMRPGHLLVIQKLLFIQLRILLKKKYKISPKKGWRRSSRPVRLNAPIFS